MIRASLHVGELRSPEDVRGALRHMSTMNVVAELHAADEADACDRLRQFAVLAGADLAGIAVTCEPAPGQAAA